MRFRNGLLDLAKAVRGSEKPSHKYKSRKPKAGGGFDYVYKDGIRYTQKEWAAIERKRAANKTRYDRRWGPDTKYDPSGKMTGDAVAQESPSEKKEAEWMTHSNAANPSVGILDVHEIKYSTQHQAERGAEQLRKKYPFYETRVVRVPGIALERYHMQYRKKVVTKS